MTMDWHVQDRWMLLATVGIGAILMYLFDALTGSRRRAWLREHLVSSIHRSRDALAPIWRDACNLVRELFAEAKTLLRKSPLRKS